MISRIIGPYLGWIAVAALVAAAGLGLLLRESYVENGRQAAEVARAARANADLLQSIEDMRAFQNEVRAGFKALQDKVSGLWATNTAYRKRVDSDADSKTPLSVGERDSLGVLFGPGDAVRAGAAGPIRGPGAP